jgi:hypothetical protein
MDLASFCFTDRINVGSRKLTMLEIRKEDGITDKLVSKLQLKKAVIM